MLRLRVTIWLRSDLGLFNLGEYMNKQEYLEWIKELESQGLDADEIEQIIQDYLEQSCED